VAVPQERRDAHFENAAVVASFPYFAGVGKNLIAMVTCRECLITKKHPESRFVQAGA
jgi:hypothetical protein